MEEMQCKIRPERSQRKQKQRKTAPKPRTRRHVHNTFREKFRGNVIEAGGKGLSEKVGRRGTVNEFRQWSES